jgi:hypothetical protein
MAKQAATTFARRDDFPIDGCSRADGHTAPADPSASSAPSAPSGLDFAFCLSQRLSASAVNIFWRLPLCLCGALLFPAAAQDAREIVRRSVELDRDNWIERADYTWVGHSRERHFDAHDQVTSDHRETWETLILDGLPFTRMLARDGKPLPPAEQRKQQQKLDRETARLASETPEEKQKRAADFEKSRRRERAFLLEIPDAFDLHLDGSDTIDGQDVWVVSGVPKPGYQTKTRDGAALSKIRGKMWIEKAGYQWVRVEAETIETISFGLFLARLSPGAKLVLEQTRIDDELWLPKREYMVGKGRIALLKRIAEDDEITWSDYRKFSVDSRIVPRDP